MKIYLFEKQGFCKGVQRAVDMALAVKDKAYCLGKLVHNDKVIAELESKGIVTVNSVNQVPDGATLIIRAHGVAPEVYKNAEERNIKIIDATCPSVRAIQQKAKKYYDDGYKIILVGDATHPEIIGINGWCNNSATIFDGHSAETLEPCEKAVIMFQTTFDTTFFNYFLENLSTDGIKTLVIFNTICYTTTERQNYVLNTAPKCDLAVVVGDKHSANTARLYELAKGCCNTIWVESDKDLDYDLSQCKNICIIAGASTPTELMKGVFSIMSENAKETVVVETVASEEANSKEEKVMDKNEAMLAKAVSEIHEGKYHPGQKVKCRVVQKNEDGVYVRLNSWKQEAFISNEELTLDGDYSAFKSALKENDTLECAIISIENGKILLSKKVIDERYKDDELVGGIKEGKEFECTMTRVGKECVTGKLGSYTVIVHASQIKIGYVKNLDAYVGKKLRLVSSAEKVDENKHVIFASQKTILLAEKKAKEDEFWNNIEVDEIVEGTVLRFAPFGAFIDVRGFDCLAHTSDLAWERIATPGEVLEIGKSYEFVVLNLDREKNRVSLGYKQLQPQPWEVAAEKFAVGSIVKGTVARIMEYGAFVELDKHIDGLLHVSNISWEWLDDINKAIKVGDEIEVKVMEFDGERKRITLSRKELLPKPEQPAEAEAPAEERVEDAE